MTQFSVTAGVIGGLSIGFIHALNIIVPDHPLGEPEVQIVVGICAAVVLSVRWMVRRLRHVEADS